MGAESTPEKPMDIERQRLLERINEHISQRMSYFQKHYGDSAQVMADGERQMYLDDLDKGLLDGWPDNENIIDYLSRQVEEKLRLPDGSFDPEFDGEIDDTIFSDTVIKLFERVKNGDSKILKVAMNAGKTLEFSPDSTDEEIFTYGLGGCTAVAVASRDARGGGTYP